MADCKIQGQAGRSLTSNIETEQSYYRARYYDASAGRFLNEDSIGFGGGADFYSYVGNSSTNLVDPSGNSARLNPRSRCADVFAKALKTGLCPGDFADAFNQAASGIPIYTVHSGNSPASGLTENAISGNGKTQTLGSSFFGSNNPPNAFTLTDGSQPAIVLGPGYFNQPLDARIASLIHEELHALTGLNDGDLFALFAKYGLPDTDFKLWPHPTKELSDWIKKGCPGKK